MCDIWQTMEGAGNRVTWCRKQNTRSSREQKVEQPIRQEKGIEMSFREGVKLICDMPTKKGLLSVLTDIRSFESLVVFVFPLKGKLPEDHCDTHSVQYS